MSEDIGELLYRRLKATQRELGLARFELGTLLEVFRTNESLWRGRAESFSSFLEEERIQADGARQFMRVAKRYVLDLGLDDQMLATLACVNFRILQLAAKTITHENQDDVLAMIVALGERDAKAALLEMTDVESKPTSMTTMSTEVKALMRRFRDLPDDQRVEFMSQFNRNRGKPRPSDLAA